MDGERLAKYESILKDYSGEDQIISLDEGINLIKQNEVDTEYFKSLIPTFDKLTNGFCPGELIVLSGPTSHGKTSLARTLTVNFASQNIKSLWFSYEEQLQEFAKKFEKLPLFAYIPKKLTSNSLQWINARIWEAKIKYDVKAVFIDHLHFLVDLEKLKNPSIEIGSILRSLKRMAVARNVAIFLIAHLTKTKLEDEPDNEHLRDSSFVAQEANCTIFIWRIFKNGTFQDEAILKIAKHRRTGIMGKKIHLKYFNNQFYEFENFSSQNLF